MLADVLYMTTVRVDESASAAWDAFYDEWVRVFVGEVPGTRRGARWRVTSGRADGLERLPPPGWPTLLATMEYARIDEFILSRAWRRAPTWEPRVRSFRPWFPSLQDYATLNLQSIGKRLVGGGAALGGAMLSTIWTIAPERVDEFESWYAPEMVHGLDAALPELLGVHRYVALLAQLHRHGGTDGELVIPQRHHLEDGGRLCYVTLFELSTLPDSARQEHVLTDLAQRLAHWDGVVADRQEAFADRFLLVQRED